MDLRRLKVVPEDSAGARILAVDLDDGARRRDQVDGQVVRGRLQVLPEDLEPPGLVPRTMSPGAPPCGASR